jgi:DNA replication protein DnaC
MGFSTQEAPRGPWLKRLQPWCKPHLLILAERGDLPLERPIATCLLPVVATRDAQGAMMLSRPPACRAWGALVTAQGLATALREQLRHHSTSITIRGQRYRLKATRQAGVFQRPERLEAAPAPA